MALARSASVPGGLSINTGAANLFGSPAASQAPASGGLFGSAAASTTPKPAGGLFGTPATTTAAAPAASTPSLFGAPAATTATTTAAAPAAGGLFGGGATAAAKPALGGGLFGAATPAATTAPAAGGGLFGDASTTATTTAPATGGGLFGGAAASTTAAPATGGGLFGASTAAKPATPSGGLFGASTTAAAAPAASSSLFGATASQPQQQQQQVVPGVRIDLSNLKGTTRFNDLQESLQKDIIAFDSLIQSYIEQKNQVEAFLPAHSESLEAIPGDVRFVARKYDGVSAAMASDLQSIQALRETVKQDAEHAQLSFKALDNQKLPAQFHTSGLWSTGGSGAPKKNGRGRDGAGGDDRDSKNGDRAGGDGGGRTDLINYFSHTGDEIGQQLRKLESNLGEIEVHMYSVQSGLLEQLQRIAASSSSSGGASASASAGANGDGSGSSSDDKVAELAAVLRDFEESILSVASVVGSARESMTGLQLGDFLGRGR
ncbi:hypothetical protein SBRCBS47491_003218 [Sporothrix bragantina]|uniref:Nucleoporin n=1 Tax=Sporothrix bragantina TaxID=671064 RepID=A0ABP0BDH4_9PEZI